MSDRKVDKPRVAYRKHLREFFKSQYADIECTAQFFLHGGGYNEARARAYDTYCRIMHENDQY